MTQKKMIPDSLVYFWDVVKEIPKGKDEGFFEK